MSTAFHFAYLIFSSIYVRYNIRQLQGTSRKQRTYPFVYSIRPIARQNFEEVRGGVKFLRGSSSPLRFPVFIVGACEYA